MFIFGEKKINKNLQIHHFSFALTSGGAVFIAAEMFVVTHLPCCQKNLKVNLNKSNYLHMEDAAESGLFLIRLCLR